MSELREELAALAASVRAYAEWPEATGAAGLPVDGLVTEALAQLDAPSRDGRAPVRSAPARAAEPAPPVVAARAERPARGSALEAPVPSGPAPGPAPAEPSPVEPLSREERQCRLSVVQEQVRGCTKCPLAEGRTQTVFSRGDPMAELCFVGEGPGADEDRLGAPFVGKAGQLLDKMIEAMGFRPEDVYVCNVVKCRPPNNRKPEIDEMAACLPYLRDQLEVVRPKVMVALGATAMQGLLGTSEGITRLRGKWKLYRGTIPIMPTFHPAYLLRQPAAKRDVWGDLQQVMKQLGRTVPDKRGGSPRGGR